MKPILLKCKQVFITRLCCIKDRQVKMPPIEHIKKILPKEQFESVELENFQMVENMSKLFFWMLLMRQLMTTPAMIRDGDYLILAIQWVSHSILAWLFLQNFKLERRRYLLLVGHEICFYRNIYTCFMPGAKAYFDGMYE